jgi:hypothetical protein
VLLITKGKTAILKKSNFKLGHYWDSHLAGAANSPRRFFSFPGCVRLSVAHDERESGAKADNKRHGAGQVGLPSAKCARGKSSRRYEIGVTINVRHD